MTTKMYKKDKEEIKEAVKEAVKERNAILPSWVYESLRYITVALLPTIGVVITTLADVWGWDLPAQQISTTLDVIGMALGALFLGSKIVTDQNNA